MITLPWILAHFIGDYLLQNDYIAKYKKVNSLVCLIHVILYMLPFLLCNLSVLQFSLIAIQHYAQDRTQFVSWYCKTFGAFQLELKKDSLPWGHFIVDNIFHFIWMWFVISYL